MYLTPVTLPASNWELNINKGQAWVFCESGNYVLHTDATMYFDANEGDITIRHLYAKSLVKFTANRLG